MPDPDREITQLSFDVGGERPNVASLKISGGLALTRELRKGETVGIRIIDADGQILAEGDGAGHLRRLQGQAQQVRRGGVDRACSHGEGAI